MSSILRAALAVFASCTSLHVCARKETQRLAAERQAGDSPALPVAKPFCTTLDASLIPKDHLWGVRLYVTRT